MATRNRQRKKEREPFVLCPSLAARVAEDARRVPIQRNRGTAEQREEELRQYYAQRQQEPKYTWQRAREIPPDDLRNRPEVVAAYRAMPYKEYLLTRWWITIKRAALKRAEYSCAKCNASNTVLHVHHLTYDRLGTEKDTDLQVLCKKCHNKEHGIV